MQGQVRRAIEEADHILFLVDAQTGVHPRRQGGRRASAPHRQAPDPGGQQDRPPRSRPLPPRTSTPWVSGSPCPSPPSRARGSRPHDRVFADLPAVAGGPDAVADGRGSRSPWSGAPTPASPPSSIASWGRIGRWSSTPRHYPGQHLHPLPARRPRNTSSSTPPACGAAPRSMTSSRSSVSSRPCRPSRHAMW